jgi:catechol 2,3-dioxygenase-like lactoylglutathione lyase family enzyme
VALRFRTEAYGSRASEIAPRGPSRSPRTAAGLLRPESPSGSALVQYHRPEMSAITHLFAGVPVSDLDASIEWYTRLFGRPPDSRVGEEILWEIDERAWLFIEPNAAWAGAGRITLAVAGLDAMLERLAAQRIEHEPIETYSNGVRHVNVPDPDGNAIAFAEPPDAGSASPRSAGPGASS